MFPSRIRSLGTATMAMCMVASGKADAYFEMGPHIWDFAAGDLLVREAGGTVVDTTGTVKPPVTPNTVTAPITAPYTMSQLLLCTIKLPVTPH